MYFLELMARGPGVNLVCTKMKRLFGNGFAFQGVSAPAWARHCAGGVPGIGTNLWLLRRADTKPSSGGSWSLAVLGCNEGDPEELSLTRRAPLQHDHTGVHTGSELKVRSPPELLSCSEVKIQLWVVRVAF